MASAANIIGMNTQRVSMPVSIFLLPAVVWRDDTLLDKSDSPDARDKSLPVSELSVYVPTFGFLLVEVPVDLEEVAVEFDEVVLVFDEEEPLELETLDETELEA